MVDSRRRARYQTMSSWLQPDRQQQKQLYCVAIARAVTWLRGERCSTRRPPEAVQHPTVQRGPCHLGCRCGVQAKFQRCATDNSVLRQRSPLADRYSLTSNAVGWTGRATSARHRIAVRLSASLILAIVPALAESAEAHDVSSSLIPIAARRTAVPTSS